MKNFAPFLLALLTAASLVKAGEAVVVRGGLRLEKASVQQVLEVYAEVSGRKLLSTRNLPEAEISFQNQITLTREQAIKALARVLSEQASIEMVPMGDKIIKPMRALKIGY